MHRTLAPLLALILLLTAVPAQAATPPTGAGPTDPRELEEFVDPIFEQHLAEHHIPGAVFVVVKDGEIFFQKGYGVADIAEQRPVDPERTLFSVGSVTKLFTGTAVMQLVEQGKLDLHADINQYLKDFQIPETYPKPITTAHLLTHTAGFDEVFLGMAARTEAEVEPLSEYLARTLPRRIRPPGQEYQYSNHGLALAGHLVEVISGQPYVKYINEQILQPLGMSRSTLGLPADLAPDLAKGYLYTGTGYEEEPVWHLNVGPAGNLKATGADMARFMIAHLQKGRYGDVRILAEETAAEMQRQHFTHHPKLPGSGYAFMERFRSNQRIIEHAGDVAGTSTQLVLVPEGNWGFFASYTSNRGGIAVKELADRLIDHYAPTPAEPAPAPPADFSKRAARFTGIYQPNRYPRFTMAKLALFNPGWRVTANDDATLTLRGPGDMRPPIRLVEVEPLLFQEVNGNGYYAFDADEQGRITKLYLPDYVIAMDKIPWYGRYDLHLGLLALVCLLLLTAVLVWLGGWLLRRIQKRPALPPEMSRARWVAAAVAVLIPLFLVRLLMVLSRPMDVIFGMTPALKAVLALPLLSTALTLAMLWLAVRAWRSAAWPPAARLHYAVVTGGALLFIPFLWYWNLLGF